MDFTIEKEIFKTGTNSIGSLDEAGRGALAGPVVAACFIVDKERDYSEFLSIVKDSKKLTAKKREQVYQLLTKEFPEITVGVSDNICVDRINVLQATFLAMKKAIGALKDKPEILLIDGNQLLPNVSIKQRCMVEGDNLVFSIAAASIIAKVTRDRMMRDYHEEFPQYGFDKHKGYGTKQHVAAINKYGPSTLHRSTFLH